VFRSVNAQRNDYHRCQGRGVQNTCRNFVCQVSSVSAERDQTKTGQTKRDTPTDVGGPFQQKTEGKWKLQTKPKKRFVNKKGKEVDTRQGTANKLHRTREELKIKTGVKHRLTFRITVPILPSIKYSAGVKKLGRGKEKGSEKNWKE